MLRWGLGSRISWAFGIYCLGFRVGSIGVPRGLILGGWSAAPSLVGTSGHGVPRVLISVPVVLKSPAIDPL